jgi:beta-glucosidase/6-phospho-beta-glucosidase/beta-galactosidase
MFCSMMFLQEDVQIIKKMGFDFYRFSISWPRILPSKKTQLHSSIFEMFIDLYLNSNDKVR